MAEATFQPAAPVGHSVNAAISGIEEGQSMMQRASNLRQSQQMEQFRQQQIDQARVLAPVIAAKAQADQISAVASIANNARLEHLRGQAAATSKPAMDEFLDAMQLSDLNSKAAALAGLQAKFQWMSLLPEYKGFVDTINDERVKAHGAALVDAHMEQQLAASGAAYQRAIDVATIGAGSRESIAKTGAEARIQATEISNDGRSVSAQTAKADREARLDLAKYKSLQAAAILNDREAAKAQTAGEADNAAIYRKHAEEFRAQAEKELAKPVEPVKFNVPNAAPEDTLATNGAPEDTPAVEEVKLYLPPAQPGEVPSFSPAVKTPEDVISSMNQMVKDGAITIEQARATLTKLGYTKKKGK